MSRGIVFLDRDGVLNEVVVRGGKSYSPASVETFRIVPEAAAQLARLKHHGYSLIVATNQPEVARGTITKAEVEKMHDELRNRLPIDGVEVCWHDDPEGCACRKPQPGLLERALHRLQADPSLSYMIGDRWRDIEAGRRAGTQTVLLQASYSEPQAAAIADYVASDLPNATDWILSRR